MKIYLAGAMAGKPDHNFPAFNAKAAELRALGHEVYNPAELEPDVYASKTVEEAAKFHNASYRRCLCIEIEWITKNADAIYLLEGWEFSPGANAEFTVAKAVGCKFFYEASL